MSDGGRYRRRRPAVVSMIGDVFARKAHQPHYRLRVCPPKRRMLRRAGSIVSSPRRTDASRNSIPDPPKCSGASFSSDIRSDASHGTMPPRSRTGSLGSAR
jgi:hypothetical protein